MAATVYINLMRDIYMKVMEATLEPELCACRTALRELRMDPNT